jgi:hypothetical protein
MAKSLPLYILSKNTIASLLAEYYFYTLSISLFPKKPVFHPKEFLFTNHKTKRNEKVFHPRRRCYNRIPD